MNAAARIGILGGTLDPIHVGHVETALAARAALALDRVIIIPARVPPHRHQQPVASAYHRFAMVAMAVNGIDGLCASDMELRAPAPSYTADTLTRIHERQGTTGSQVFFITGADAFAEIETWHRYPDVLELANFVVVSRPGFPVSMLSARLPSLAGRMHSAAMPHDEPGNPLIFLLDAKTPDVSSTGIRRRLAGGEPLPGLVPAAVATHIAQHALYTHVDVPSRANELHGQD